MTHVGVLLRKELLESWRTRRLPLVAILFVLVGLISPLTARYLPEILRGALGDQLTGSPLPPADATQAVAQLQKNLGQLGALAAIALAMGSVAGELDRGTAALVLAQPVGRPAFLAAKLMAIGIVLAVATGLCVAAAWLYTVILFGMQPVGGWLALLALEWLALLVWAAITVWASAATASSMAAAGLGFVALIVLSLAGVIPALERLLPAGLEGPAGLLATGLADGLDAARLATAIAGSALLIGLSAVGAAVAFGRREL